MEDMPYNLDDRKNGVVMPGYTEAVFVVLEIVKSNSRPLRTSGRDRRSQVIKKVRPQEGGIGVKATAHGFADVAARRFKRDLGDGRHVLGVTSRPHQRGRQRTTIQQRKKKFGGLERTI